MPRTLVSHYSLDDVVHLRVQPDSTLVGSARDTWDDLQSYEGMNVITVLDGESHQAVFEGVVAAGDRLTVVGRPDVVRRYADDCRLGVESARGSADVAQAILNRESGAAEVVVPPRSRFEGEAARPGHVLNGRLLVLAVQRQGQDRGATTTELEVGDVLLVEGDWSALNEITDDRELLVVDAPDLVRRQAVPMGARSREAVLVLVAMVVLLATGVVPAVIATMLAAGAMIVLRVVSVQQAYRGISWTTVLLVAGLIPLSTAITDSGAAQKIADVLVDAVGDAGPTVLLIALFVVTVAFGQLISNTATALVMIPVAVSAASQLDISARPVLMSVCVAASASFLTPVATPANMMVMGPGGYRFGDYWKLGLPIILRVLRRRRRSRPAHLAVLT